MSFSNAVHASSILEVDKRQGVKSGRPKSVDSLFDGGGGGDGNGALTGPKQAGGGRSRSCKSFKEATLWFAVHTTGAKYPT